MSSSQSGYLELDLKINDKPIIFKGKLFGNPRSIAGEVVFQTGMVGYPESITDPSYKGQILVLTFPLIGNYGIPDESSRDEKTHLLKYFESEDIQVNGLVVGEYNPRYSHWEGMNSLGEWFKSHNKVGISGIDTRALTKIIREYGSVNGRICRSDDIQPPAYPNYQDINLIAEVSITSPKWYRQENSDCEAKPYLIVVDLGIKNSQLKYLYNVTKLNLLQVPWDYDFVTPYFNDPNFRGLFLSNGPGNPSQATTTIDNLRTIFEKTQENPTLAKPIFGICMGHQLMALGAGYIVTKMKYGNRGHNIPSRFLDTNHCLITSQNHGYEVNTSTRVLDWDVFFTNANDHSNEGIVHKTLPFSSVQFHPEAKAGPEDSGFLFELLSPNNHHNPISLVKNHLPKVNYQLKYKPQKVLILGSGGLKIGQAGEFDYSGSQAIKAFKEEGLEVILINPNPATVQTSKGLADTICYLPVTPYYVEKVIQKERPDSINVSFGGQTALNCGIELMRRGILEKYNVQILGTPLKSVLESEDRQLFKERLEEINQHLAPSAIANSLEEALESANKIGYPVLVRSSFALGGLGSGFANNPEELEKLWEGKEQIMIDKSLKGWKEIEYEIVRDSHGNCLSVCNMENLDPLGVHTGESIVVAPSLTLSDCEYNLLRTTALKVVSHMGIIGECNVQYALDPKSHQYYIIEINARLSRSSALASKATGYPLAYIAAKLSLGITLPEIINSVTETTTACFEPSLDYVVVKIPRWDLKKFPLTSRKIGSAMKSVGEVRAISRSFEEALQKGLRMVDDSVSGFDSMMIEDTNPSDYIDDLINPSYNRIFLLAKALALNTYTIEELFKLTNIDRYFLTKMAKIVKMENKLKSLAQSQLQPIDILKAKRCGFSDYQIAKFTEKTETIVRKIRHDFGIYPVVKQIDTVAGEFPSDTNYLYLTYHGIENDLQLPPTDNKQTVIVLGSGVYRIGSSVEFDWCSVMTIRELRHLGYKTVMINYNPETVSTDYDEADRLYFDQLSLETVLDIYQLENPMGVIVSVGGQIPNNIALKLSQADVNILGTAPEMIDMAENRFKFSRLLDDIGIDQPEWKEATDYQSMIDFCQKVSYPVLIRPSYVLSGAAMTVIYNQDDLKKALVKVKEVSKEYPVVISKFIKDSKEIEVDGVSNHGWVELLAISEHVENAGTHSGDATMFLPYQDLSQETIKKIKDATYLISKNLKINGPFNIQFMAKDDNIKVIECNLRVSRTFPFVSKTFDINFISHSTKYIMNMGVELAPNVRERIEYQKTPNNVIGVKVPQFSFNRLDNADSRLGVEMLSTGEVSAYSKDKHTAYLKGLMASGFRIPLPRTILSHIQSQTLIQFPENFSQSRNVLLTIGGYQYKKEFENHAKILSQLGYHLFGTQGTADYYQEHSIRINHLDNYLILDKLRKKEFGLVIGISYPKKRPSECTSTFGFQIRRLSITNDIGLITNIKNAKLFVDSLTYFKDILEIDLDYDAKVSYQMLKIPLLVDFHTHCRDWEQSQIGTIYSETQEALNNGIGTVIMMPNTYPRINSLQHVRKYLLLASQTSCTNFYVNSLPFTNHQDYQDLDNDSETRSRFVGFKLYLEDKYPDLDMSFEEVKTFLEILKTQVKYDYLVSVHASGHRLASFLYLLELLEYRGSVHICHVGNRNDFQLVSNYRSRHSEHYITMEATVHHLFLNKDDNPNIKICPALPSKEDQEFLQNNIDEIDIIVTDHAPHKEHNKDYPGQRGFKVFLPLLLKAVYQDQLLTLDEMLKKTFYMPRQILGLDIGYNSQDNYFNLLEDKHFFEVNLDIPIERLDSRYYPENYNQLELKGIVKKINIVIEKLSDKLNRHIANINCDVPIDTLGKQLTVNDGVPDDDIDIDEADISQHREMIRPTIDFKSKDFISVKELPRDFFRMFFKRTSQIRELWKEAYDNNQTLTILKGRTIGLIFTEASTRTKSSFITAIQNLGGNVLQLDYNTSSARKGETLYDCARTFENLLLPHGGLIMRSSEAGSLQSIARDLKISIINAGDGDGEHPTQALLDAYTIREERGSINGISIAFVGDLRYSRTVHSLAYLLGVYSNITFKLVSPESRMMPREVVSFLLENGHQVDEDTGEEAFLRYIRNVDVVYMTRLQEERDSSITNKEYLSQYCLKPKHLNQAKSDLIIMHPLPRNGEIDQEIDTDHRAVYFKQVNYGMYVRMALLEMMFE